MPLHEPSKLNRGLSNNGDLLIIKKALALVIWAACTFFDWLEWILPAWISWKPTSSTLLAEAESRMLYNLQSPYEVRDVHIPDIKGIKGRNTIRTLCMFGSSKEATPIVLLHGFGCGLGMWALNLDELHNKGTRTIYAIDMLGFGRSSRPQFSVESLEAENQFVEAVENWRKQMNIKRALWLGHGLGGFIASSFALKHPEYVAHLILVDPWGIPERSSHTEKHLDIPPWSKMVVNLLHPFNPLAILRAAGPLGPKLVIKFRPDLRRKFDNVIKDKTVVPNYIYHINAQTPTGEAAFRCMMNSLGWATHPMVSRMPQLSTSIAITFVYGSRSWVDKAPGVRVKHMRPHSPTDVQVVEGAGHHVYADKADEFNALVKEIAQNIDLEPTLDEADGENY